MKQLTPTHVKIITLVAQGYVTNAIAYKLHMSFHTARHHREEIYRRLGVGCSSAAVAAAIFNGYITRETWER